MIQAHYTNLSVVSDLIPFDQEFCLITDDSSSRTTAQNSLKAPCLRPEEARCEDEGRN